VRSATVPALAVLLAACGTNDTFPCRDASQCVLGGAAGRCEAVGWCSFPDASCSGGFRFGDYAPPEIAGTCVGPDGTVVLALTAAADAWIDSGKPGVAYGLSATLSADGDPAANILLRFDLGGVPAGARLLQATLQVTTTPDGALAQGSADVYVLRQAWAEGFRDDRVGSPNWTMRDDTTTWAGPGASAGARGDAPIATFAPSTASTRFAVPVPLATVASWVAMPALNDGLVLVLRDAGSAAAKIHAREAGDPNARPRLVVAYKP